MLKIFPKAFGLLTLLAFFFTSCSNEKATVQPTPSKAMQAFEIESYTIVKKRGDDITFTTQQEVLDYLAGSDRYEAIKEKFDFINTERKIILELGLVEKSEDDPAVVEYLKQFETTHLRTGPVNFCHHDEHRSGKTVWTPYSNPSIRSANRNRYSSITAVAPQVLCNNRWYGGRHFFYWGTHDFLKGNNNNNSESYY